jgi:hypothetical protein
MEQATGTATHKTPHESRKLSSFRHGDQAMENSGKNFWPESSIIKLLMSLEIIKLWTWRSKPLRILGKISGLEVVFVWHSTAWEVSAGT